jgi:hypothetical protein
MSARESISGRTEPKLNDLGVVIGVVMIRFISWSPRAVIKRFRLDEDETSTNLINENHGLTPLSDPDNFHPVAGKCECSKWERGSGNTQIHNEVEYCGRCNKALES